MAGRRILGFFLGLVVWLWLRTLRLRVVDESGDADGDDRPWVLAFFHGTQVPLLAWRRRRETVVLVSHSRDGELQNQVMRRARMHVVRGSTSSGGARGLATIVRALREGGRDAAFAVDGPRGPRGVVQPGVVACAKLTGGRVVPMGSAARPTKVLARTWDRFALPWPFARAVVVIGAPVPSEASVDDVARAIERANERAARELDPTPGE